MTAEKQRILATKLGTKKLSDLISEGEKLYPGKDWAEYSDIEMSTAFAGWTEKATDLREDFITANSNLEACQCDETTFKDLPDTDKIFVTLICHSVMPKMGLDSDLVPESLGKTIATWYQSGKGMSGFRPLSGSYISQYHPRNPMSCLGRIGGLRGKSNFIEMQPFWKVKNSHKSSI